MTTLCASVLVGALLGGVQPSVLGFFVASAVFSTWRNRKHRRQAEAFWSIVWHIRHAAAGDRPRLLADLQPSELRVRVERILASDITDEPSGELEQFPFPTSLRRQATRLYWAMWSIAVGLLAVSALSSPPVFYRIVGIALATLCGWFAWRASQQEAFLQSVLEVTPFRISELLPDGAIRSLSWNNDLELHYEPKNSRLVLKAGSSDEGIPLDYRRMGFSRLIERVRLYGKFPTLESPPPAS